MKTGLKLRKLRKLKGFSQEHMAQMLDMSQNNYSKIKLGKVQLTLDRLQRISDLLGMDIVQVMEFDDNTIFNNHEQKAGNSANYIIQEYSEKMEEVCKEQIEQLKSEIRHLLKLLK